MIFKTIHIGTAQKESTKLAVLVLLIDHVKGKKLILNTFIKSCSVYGLDIKCNCDDQKTGLTDDNILTAMDQLPVTGNSQKLAQQMT